MAYHNFRVLSFVSPTIEPISLEETKTFIRVDDTSDDTLISNLIIVARQVAETYLKRSLITQTLKMEFDQYAPSSFELVLGPIQSIVEVTLTNRDGSNSTVDNSTYYLTAGKDNIVFDATPVSHKVTIEYIAGYGDNVTDIPEPIRQGMLTHVARMYDNRTGNSTMPTASKNLYMPYKKVRL